MFLTESLVEPHSMVYVRFVLSKQTRVWGREAREVGTLTRYMMKIENSETVLVTGGTGYVGAQCILQLLQKGHNVKTTLRSMNKKDEIIEILKTGGVKGHKAATDFVFLAMVCLCLEELVERSSRSAKL